MSKIENVYLSKTGIPSAPWYKNPYCITVLINMAFEIEDEYKQYSLKQLAADYHTTQKEMKVALSALADNGDIDIEYVDNKRGLMNIRFCSKLILR